MQVPGRGPPAHEAHELLLLVHDGHDGHDRSLIVQQGRPFARSKKAGMEGQLRGWSLQPLVEEGLGGVDLALSGDVGRHDHLTREVHQEELVDARRLAAARPRDGQRHLVLCLEDVAQQLLHLVHEGDELRIEMAQQGMRHGAQHARVHHARAWPEKDSFGCVQVSAH